MKKLPSGGRGAEKSISIVVAVELEPVSYTHLDVYKRQAETIRLSKRAEEMGADALSIITPSFALASQKELYDHYVAVAKQVNIPIILYNIPPRTRSEERRVGKEC